MDFLRSLSRKRLDRSSGASSIDFGSISSSSYDSTRSGSLGARRAPSVEQELHNVCCGTLAPATPDSVAFSSAGYAALDPCRDIHILTTDKAHAFAAVLTFGAEAQPNGRYLQRNLHREVLEHVAETGDVAAAFQAAFVALNRAYRNLHPFNGPVLKGVRVAVAYVDLRTQTLHLVANSGCRAVAGRAAPGGKVRVVADVGRGGLPGTADTGAKPGREAGDAAPIMVCSVALSEAVDTIVVASEGVWRELPAHSALLRLQLWAACGAPALLRPAGGAAGQLVNATLHAVAARAGRLADPRMRSLRSVSHLASLWAGDRSSYKYRGRQVVRRRRGDVHGDLTVVVLQVGAAVAAQPVPLQRAAPASGALAPANGALAPAVGRPAVGKTRSPEAVRARAAARWALLRMHFLTYRRAARNHALAQWDQVIATGSGGRRR
ncbi:hypothetical protein WJX81_000323 [Elliptochloris bilobata]|uniref:PPM-type phosphatase domain-containing protein n=1 Tax=Elliptochloris bilobata TaxID=381761 RepID=A0AAW1RUL1_9CHLO